MVQGRERSCSIWFKDQRLAVDTSGLAFTLRRPARSISQPPGNSPLSLCSHGFCGFSLLRKGQQAMERRSLAVSGGSKDFRPSRMTFHGRPLGAVLETPVPEI